jgi:hypothetical protein
MFGQSDFGERIFQDRESGTRQLLQPPPRPRHSLLLLRDGRGVEKSLGKRTLASDRLEIRVHNKLGQHGIAANVTFPANVEPFRRNFPQDVAEIQIRIGHRFNVQAAYLTEVALFAFSHIFLSKTKSKEPSKAPLVARLAGF